MQGLIEQYIQSKQSCWSPTTMRSERYRLRGLTLDSILAPEALWAQLNERLSPYAAKTAFTRAGEFLDFLMLKGHTPPNVNVLKQWMKGNSNLFKYAYQPKAIAMTFEQAKTAIEGLTNEGHKQKALQLLATGMRYEESMKLSDAGTVVGKGGGIRTIPLAKQY